MNDYLTSNGYYVDFFQKTKVFTFSYTKNNYF